MVAVLAEGLVLDLAYGYTDAEFDISNIASVARTPENTLNVGLQYDFTPFSFGSVSARVDANYLDDFDFHPYNNRYDSADDRWLLNARLSLNDVAIGERGAPTVST